MSTVFIVAPTLWHPTVTGKYFYFAMSVAFASLVTAFYLFRSGSFFRLCLTDLAVLCFAAWVLAGCVVNRAHCGMNLWLFVLLVPLYLIFRATLHDRNLLHLLVLVIVSVVAVEAVWGLLQLHGFLNSYHGLFVITGSFFNPGPFAGFLACGVPLALHCVLNGKRRAVKFLGLACLLAVGLILPATMSRAAWMAVFAGSFPVVLQQLKIISQPSSIIRRKSKIVFVFAALFVVGSFYGLYAIKKQSADGRLLIWRVSAGLVGEQPIIGSGLGSFKMLYDGAQAGFFLSGKTSENQSWVADSPKQAFNEYIQIAVEHGLIGLLLFLCVIYSSISGIILHRSKSEKLNSKTADSVGFSVLGSLIAFCVFSFFSYPFSILPLTILFVVIIAMSASLSQPIERLQSRWVGAFVGVLCLAMTCYGSFEILSRYIAYSDWKSVQSLHGENTRDIYHRLYPKMNRHPQFLFEYARLLSEADRYETSNAMLARYLLFGSDPVVFNCMGDNYRNLGMYKEAENMYFRALQIVPSRHLPLYLLMKLYQETGEIEKAKAMAKELLEKPVKVPSAAIRNMHDEARKLL